MAITAQSILKRSLQLPSNAVYQYSGSGPVGWDCSGYIAFCCGWTGHPFSTDEEKSYLINNGGFTDVSSEVNFSNGDGMKPGDVLILHRPNKFNPATGAWERVPGHTAIYIGDGLIRHAGGKEGSSIPKVNGINYNPSDPWTQCVRPKGAVYIDTWNGKKKTR